MIEEEKPTFGELISLAQKKRWANETPEARKEQSRKMLKNRWKGTTAKERKAFASRIGKIGADKRWHKGDYKETDNKNNESMGN